MPSSQRPNDVVISVQRVGSGNGGTKTLTGTSMATLHVAGVTALWAEQLLAQGPLSPLLLQAKLIGSATFVPLSAGTDPLDAGAGLVQAPTNTHLIPS